MCYIDFTSVAKKREKKEGGQWWGNLKFLKKNELIILVQLLIQAHFLIQSPAYKNQSLPELITLSTSLPIFQLRSNGYAYSDPFLSDVSYTSIQGLLLHTLPAAGIPMPVFFVNVSKY